LLSKTIHILTLIHIVELLYEVITLFQEELNKLVLCYSTDNKDCSLRQIQVAEKCRLHHLM